MNGYDRIRKVLAGEWPDRRPVMLHNFMMAAREKGMTMKQFRENPVNAANAFIHAAEKYDADGILIDIDTATLAGAAGATVDFPEDEPARILKPALTVLEEVKDLPDNDIAEDPRVQIWLEVCRIVKDYFKCEKFVRGNCDQAPFSLASMIRGPQHWMTDLVIENENVILLLEYATGISRKFIQLVAETGVDMVSNGDSPAGPEMISPEMYRSFALPYEKKMAETAHEMGLPYALHICGNTDLILEDMMQTGADAFELDYKTDINRIFDLCNRSVTLIGNIDPSDVLCFGTTEVVREKVTELLTIYRASPRLIVNAGCAIPPYTPGENILQLIRTTRSDGNCNNTGPTAASGPTG